MARPPIDDLVVESWRTEPRLSGLQALELDDAPVADAPALWKDVAIATIIAVALWLCAAALFG
jgi:hypothetical protein